LLQQMLSHGSTNTEPEAVVTGSNTHRDLVPLYFYSVRRLTLSLWSGRYRSRFCISPLTERRSPPCPLFVQSPA